MHIPPHSNPHSQFAITHKQNPKHIKNKQSFSKSYLAYECHSKRNCHIYLTSLLFTNENNSQQDNFCKFIFYQFGHSCSTPSTHGRPTIAIIMVIHLKKITLTLHKKNTRTHTGILEIQFCGNNSVTHIYIHMHRENGFFHKHQIYFVHFFSLETGTHKRNGL